MDFAKVERVLAEFGVYSIHRLCELEVSLLPGKQRERSATGRD